jgi:hypothetical protein
VVPATPGLEWLATQAQFSISGPRTASRFVSAADPHRVRDVRAQIGEPTGASRAHSVRRSNDACGYAELPTRQRLTCTCKLDCKVLVLKLFEVRMLLCILMLYLGFNAGFVGLRLLVCESSGRIKITRLILADDSAPDRVIAENRSTPSHRRLLRSLA